MIEHEIRNAYYKHSAYSRINADQAFSEHEKAIAGLLREINSEWRKKCQQQSKDQANWGYVGDASYIRSKLESVANFLKGHGG